MSRYRFATLGAVALLLAPGGVAAADRSASIEVARLTGAPVLDGQLDDWDGIATTQVALSPAVDDEVELTPGEIVVDAALGVFDDRLFLAFRWPDASADTSSRAWRWQGGRYRRGRELDDQFAVRFEFQGDFDQCMISDRDYVVDVWLWSAGRSALSGYADDLRFAMSSRYIGDAAEHAHPDGGTVYIKRYPDAGSAPFEAVRQPRERAGDSLPAVVAAEPGGSRGDVRAAARWDGGYWHLELQRLLHTGHDDDASFAVAEVVAQLAVFDREADQYKSVSEPLVLRLPSP